MPFDVAMVRELTLLDRLDAMGIRPVPDAVLRLHKAAELARHPPSLMARRWPWVVIGGVGCVGSLALVIPGPDLLHAQTAVVLMVCALVSIVGTILALAMAIALTTLVMVARNRQLLGYPEWRESEFWNIRTIPPEIASLVRCVRSQMPEAVIIVGELRRAEVLLDPYVVVVWEGQRACLGIWDDAGIIAKAEVI